MADDIKHLYNFIQLCWFKVINLILFLISILLTTIPIPLRLLHASPYLSLFSSSFCLSQTFLTVKTHCPSNYTFDLLSIFTLPSCSWTLPAPRSLSFHCSSHCPCLLCPSFQLRISPTRFLVSSQLRNFHASIPLDNWNQPFSLTKISLPLLITHACL